MPYKNKTIGLLICVLLICLSCKNEYGSIGLNLKGDEYLGNAFTDSLVVKAYSLPDDSIATNRLNNVVLGEINDPVFGKTTGSFFTQFALPTFGHNFGDNAVLDSAVLTLAISGYYGDTTATLHMAVRELSESILDNTTYYSASSLNTYSGEVAENGVAIIKPCPNSKIVIDTTSYEPHLRIRLTNDFGYKFLRNTTHNTSNEVFKEFFKGLYIDAITYSRNGCFVYLNVNSSLSTITLYYRDHDTASIARRYTLNSAKQNYFAHFEHALLNSSNYSFIDQVVNGNQELGKEMLYVQPLAGVKTFITFPDLINTFKDKDIVINRAELVFYNVSPDEEFFLSPEALSLTTRKDGQNAYILDDPNYSSSNTSTYFGGTYDKDKQEYRFRITRHIQYLILNDTKDPGLYVTTRGNGIRGNRLIFKGTEPAMENEKRLRLEIYYTTY
ncbi:MAG: DUF4270 domain-containing protein [Bacteroidales bacterium]|jgi:hypothetical protein|nr:DUF4270 domain-containing protein [Bacteroidales bacterium]